MSATSTLDKKRDLLGPLNKAIIALSNLSGDAAKLEIMDNNEASLRLKQAIVDFQYGELEEFKRAILDVRRQFNEKKKEKYLKTNHKKTES